MREKIPPESYQTNYVTNYGDFHIDNRPQQTYYTKLHFSRCHFTCHLNSETYLSHLDFYPCVILGNKTLSIQDQICVKFVTVDTRQTEEKTYSNPRFLHNLYRRTNIVNSISQFIFSDARSINVERHCTYCTPHIYIPYFTMIYAHDDIYLRVHIM